MGIEEETDRTLFIRNLDQRVTEELLFELFLQAGPLIKTKIPKDNDGKQKTFGFAVYKHEGSVPYAMQLLNGTALFGRTLGVQYRSGSSHSSSPGNSQSTSPGNAPNPHGLRTQAQPNPPHFIPPPQKAFSSLDSLQKQVNNMMWQQLLQSNGGGGGLLPGPPQRHQHSGGGGGGGGGSGGGARQHDGAPYWQRSSAVGSSGCWGQSSRSQRYSEDSGLGRPQHQQYGRAGQYPQHDERSSSSSSSSRHHDSRNANHPYDNRGGNRGYQDSRYRRY